MGCGSYSKKLEQLNTEEGILQLLNHSLVHEYNIQKSWLDSGVKKFKYEDMILNEYDIFCEIREVANLDISQFRYRKIIEKNSFGRLSGRKRGEEDKTKHQRKGISGDWKNCFTEKIKNEFKEKYNDVLIATGYESNDNW